MRDLLGALLAGILTVAAAILFMNYQSQSNVNQQVAATAGQAVQFNTAVQSYITQYASNVSAVATATTPAIITVPMLQASAVNLLPSSFSSTNPFGQTWQAEVLQPTAGNLQALALGIGGTALTDQVASRVAALIGSAGGFIPKNDSGTWPSGSATAQGAYAGWSVPTAGYTGIAGGNIASLLTFSNGQFVSNYLYRNNVGNASLNTMNTPIIMASVQTSGAACSNIGAIAQDGTGKPLTCQSNVWKGAGETSGVYSYFNLTSCPSGWVAADGTNGTVDIRGMFVRGLDNGRGVDGGRALASWQDSDNKSHSHGVNDPGHAHSYQFNYQQGGGDYNPNRWSNQTSGQTSVSTTGISIQNSGGSESRPINVALLACMKQ